MNQKQVVNFLAFWVSNTVVLLILSAILKNFVVLGNDKLSKPMAAVVSGLLLAALIYLVPPVVQKSGYKISDKKMWPVIFFVANAILIWIIKRLAFVFGLGISGVVWVLIVALVITAVEAGVAKATGAMSPVAAQKK